MMKTRVKLPRRQKRAQPFRKMSVTIPLRLAAMMAALVLVVGVAFQAMLTTILRSDLHQTMTYVAKSNAARITGEINQMTIHAEKLGESVVDLQGLDPASRHTLYQSFLANALKDELVFGAYFAFEPDKVLPNTPKGKSLYLYRDGDKTALDEFEDFDSYGTADYYAQAKGDKKVHITAPYEWKLGSGKVVHLITISTPIVDVQGNFLGVANCDFLSDALFSDISYETAGYDSAYTYALNDAGAYVMLSSADTKHADQITALLGQPYNGEEKDDILGALKSGGTLFDRVKHQFLGTEALYICVPIQLKDVSAPWLCGFVVDRAQAMYSVRDAVMKTVVLLSVALLLLVVLIKIQISRALRPMKDLVQLAQDMEAGSLSTTAHVTARNELGQISDAFNRTAVKLHGYVDEISALLGEISSGNLRVGSQTAYDGDFAPIQHALERIITSLGETMSRIRDAAENVSQQSTRIAGMSQTLAQGAIEQANALEAMDSTVTQVAADAQQNAAQVEDASRHMQAVAQAVEGSNAEMQLMLQAMQDIERTSGQIAGILQLVDSISEQTNLLALNATIEAARAGAAGKGFAVVADEVRNLARQSAEAAQKTSVLIAGAMDAIQNGISHAGRTADILSSVDVNTRSAEVAIQHISDASRKQVEQMQRAADDVGRIAGVVQKNSATSEQSAASSESMAAHAQQLLDEVTKFQIP